MSQHLGRSFHTIVRATRDLQTLLAGDPYAAHGIPANAKRVITFMRQPVAPRVGLPLTEDFASVFLIEDRHAFTAYVPSDNGPVFMKLIERAFGKEVTTRTLETVAKCAAA
ncbi:hypothetical protein SDC9_198111 [bioreactor metagenome]|uniref:Uncharacterized protein n=1 Tax=bioreactor metagenome TaxID=1076179 RepID=A0A645IQ56_9ZZZZ